MRMPHLPWPWKTFRCTTIVIVGAIGLIGCASHKYGAADVEQQILGELRRDGIPAPDVVGNAHQHSPSLADQAALTGTGPITLADLLNAAEARNPAIAAARSDVGISAGEIWQASLYPNPQVELSSEEIPFSSGVDEGVTTLSLTQPIVLGDRLNAAVAAAEAQEAATRARMELSIREVFGEIAQLHARLLAIRQAEALYGELAELGNQTLTMARTRFEARAATETEVIRPQIELYQIELARARLASEKAAATTQLSAMLDGVVIDAERLAGDVTDNPPEVDLAALADVVRVQHPALVAADREADAAEARLRRIRAERMPDLDVHAGAGYHGERDEGIYEIGVGVTLPLWDNRQGKVLSERYALMRARQQRSVTESEILARLAEAHGEYEAARAQLQTVRDQIVPAANRSYEQTQEAYRGGRAAFLELLDAQRTLTEARATLIELSGAAAAARAKIMQIVGQLDALPSSDSGPAPHGSESSITVSTQRPAPEQAGAEVMP
jgi:cobalt-zinc-cadmium efflux system outer membrane protein